MSGSGFDPAQHELLPAQSGVHADTQSSDEEVRNRRADSRRPPGLAAHTGPLRGPASAVPQMDAASVQPGVSTERNSSPAKWSVTFNLPLSWWKAGKQITWPPLSVRGECERVGVDLLPASRAPIPSGTLQFTQPRLNAIKEGLHSPGARMQKRRPLDHSNYSIYITQCHSGTCRTHQTLLLARPAANEAYWRHCASHLLMAGPACQQQLSPADRLPLSEPFIPCPTSDPKGYDISSPDLWSFLLADIQLLFPVFNSASLFLAKLIGSNRHLPKDYKVSQSLHKEASDLAIKSPSATIYANNNE